VRPRRAGTGRRWPRDERWTWSQLLAGGGILRKRRALAGCSEHNGISCGQLQLEVSKSTASHHLKALRLAGIIAEREEGTRKFTWLRKDLMEQRYPGLLSSVLRAAELEEQPPG